MSPVPPIALLAAAAAVGGAKGSARFSRPEPAQLRLLLVDDDDDARMLATRALARVGSIAIVGEVTSGEDALRSLAALEPDLVLMDWSMPGMDGIEATARVRAARHDVRVVGWTSTGDARLQRSFLTAGATAVFAKHELRPLVEYLARLADGRRVAR